MPRGRQCCELGIVPIPHVLIFQGGHQASIRERPVGGQHLRGVAYPLREQDPTQVRRLPEKLPEVIPPRLIDLMSNTSARLAQNTRGL